MEPSPLLSGASSLRSSSQGLWPETKRAETAKEQKRRLCLRLAETKTIISMKRKYYILGSIIILLLTYCYVDHKYFMKKRVLRHNVWDYESGELYIKNKRITRGTLFTEGLSFKGDSMIFNYGKCGKDTLILKWQYFSTMKVMDTKTKKVGKYSMKGANWTDYLFK